MRLKWLCATVVLLSLGGCSLSESSSKIVSSPFEILSASSASSSKGRESYRVAVRDYTEAYIRSNGDPATFQKGLADVAKDHGITNWQAEPNTYLAIGAGLKKAGVSKTQLEAYKKNWSGGNPDHAAGIQKGYDSE